MILRTFPCAATDPAPRATLHCAQSRGIRCRGSGGGADPEQLFAAGYAACFHSALRLVAAQAAANVNDSAVGARVGIGSIDGGGFGLTVVLEVTLPHLPEDEAQALADKAHQICPYSNATRGNIDVEVRVAQD